MRTGRLNLPQPRSLGTNPESPRLCETLVETLGAHLCLRCEDRVETDVYTLMRSMQPIGLLRLRKGQRCFSRDMLITLFTAPGTRSASRGPESRDMAMFKGRREARDRPRRVFEGEQWIKNPRFIVRVLGKERGHIVKHLVIDSGWGLKKAGHGYRLFCPCPEEPWSSIRISSTPRSATAEAAQISRQAALCPGHSGGSTGLIHRRM